MKNIIWIASYPKSGNTLVRLFLSCYFFSNDGKLIDFDIIKNITIFNNFNIFKKIKNFCNKDDFIKNPSLISNYWLEAQENLYRLYPEKVFFFKTHSSRVKYKGNYFTNEKFTRLFIYIVRDPRSVLVSTKNHYNYPNYQKCLENLFSNKHLSLAKYHVLPEFLLSWQTNYLSWKKFLDNNPNLGIIIRFEDLIKNPKKSFLKILNLIEQKHQIKFDINKFNNALKSVNFKKLQKKENELGFDEKSSYVNNFFRKGLIDEWKNEVPKTIIKKIEQKYYNEMKEIGYL